MTGVRLMGAAGLVLSLAACGNDGIVKSAAEKVGFATPEPKPQDFVIQNRTPDPNFISIPLPASTHRKPKTPDEVKKAEAQMDGIKARHDAAAKAAPPVPGN